MGENFVSPHSSDSECYGRAVAARRNVSERTVDDGIQRDFS